MVRFRRRVSAAIVAGSAACVLVACGDTESPGSDVTLTQTTQPATTTQPGKGALKRLPNLAGKGLQTAQDEAQAAGFSYLTSHDALGRGRNQVLDRNWKVCAHFPAAGQVRVETEIDFATVKLEEKCPAKTGATGAPKVDRTMLNFVGKSVKAVRDALPFSASIDTTDAPQARPDGLRRKQLARMHAEAGRGHEVPRPTGDPDRGQVWRTLPLNRGSTHLRRSPAPGCAANL